MSFIDRLKYVYLAYFSKPACDRAIYRTIRRLKPRTIVTIGLGNGERALRAIRLATTQRRGERIQFTAVDLFEMSPPGRECLGLKGAHQLLAASGAKVQLVPGDPFSALARTANTLVGTELVIVASDQAGESLERSWFYVPRMLAPGAVVLVEEQGFRTVSQIEIAALAKPDTKRRAA